MEQPPIVTVEEGKLRGKTAIDYRGGKYFSFQGIPYAKPPLGELRFKAPQPLEPWTGIRDATQEGSPCYHRNPFNKKCIGSEDCLFLNVYTPKLIGKPPLYKPVMVWIHGGAFTSGSGNTEFYGPDFLIAENVVIVTINFRLGLLGFLCLEDPSLGVPGNVGLKDIVLALRWIKKNITCFGGHPNNVTIFGQSSGGALVHYLMMSPIAKGLFQRAIIQSATALNCWARGEASAVHVAKFLEHKTVDETTILNALKDMTVEEIIKVQENLPINKERWGNAPIGPVVEHKCSPSPFLTEHPIDLITSGRFNKVPLMIGYTSKESIFGAILSKYRLGKEPLHNDCEILVPTTLNLPRGSKMSKMIAQKIKEFYYSHDELSNKEQFYNADMDSTLLGNLQYVIKQQSQTASTPIYLYRMSLDSTLNLYKKLVKSSYPGASHGDDLGYLFKTTATQNISLGSIEDSHIRKFTTLWTTFAKNGDPNPTKHDPVMNVIWKPVEKGKLHYLDIGENLTVGVNPEPIRMAFWDGIFKLTPAVAKL